MPAAANPMKALELPATMPAPTVPVDAELFAALLGGGDSVPAPDADPAPAEASEEAASPMATVEMLLPLIDQQRAALIPQTAMIAPTATSGEAPSASAPHAAADDQVSPPPVAPAMGRAAAAPDEAQATTGSVSTALPAGRPPVALGAVAGSAAPGTTIQDEASGDPAAQATPGKGQALPAAAPPQLTTDLAPAITIVAGAQTVRRAQGRPAQEPLPATSAAPNTQLADIPTTSPVAKSDPQAKPAAMPAPSETVQAADASKSFSPEPPPQATTALPPASAAPVAAVPNPVRQAQAAAALDIAPDGAWIDELARDISRIAGGAGDLRFRLTPETLGELKVEISQSERGAVIRMSVSSEAAQAAIAEAQPKLLAEARAQGVRIADAQIDLASSHQNKGDGQRHQPAQFDQPLRAMRNGHPDTRSAAAPTRGRTDRYA